MDSKIQNGDSVRPLLEKIKSEKKTIVFTNGCFDILHPGHVYYLNHAKNMGDCLVVGLNTDASVKRIKGPKRPLVCEKDRARVLASLESVDYVVFFDDDTPQKLIEIVKPDILVKGGDYRKDEIMGADIVKAYGGKVATIDFLDGFSTTEMISKIKAL
ncbi:D-glycero-beta-D-manno-heptose 1-phosphate adenylyltransferase [PVC group bacterium]|nr:D-glycero-beta-D-manno-heptose 1-phosphate adenylyltransferase [PVC group bacterium]